MRLKRSRLLMMRDSPCSITPSAAPSSAMAMKSVREKTLPAWSFFNNAVITWLIATSGNRILTSKRKLVTVNGTSSRQ